LHVAKGDFEDTWESLAPLVRLIALKDGLRILDDTDGMPVLRPIVLVVRTRDDELQPARSMLEAHLRGQRTPAEMKRSVTPHWACSRRECRTPR